MFIRLTFGRYTVMSGTPQKMLEHLLETRLGGHVGPNDPFLDDFLLTHIVFMQVPVLIDELAHLFHSCIENTIGTQSAEDREYMLTCRKRVIQFVQKWVVAVRQVVFEDQITVEFIEVYFGVHQECFGKELRIIEKLLRRNWPVQLTLIPNYKRRPVLCITC